MISSKVVSGLTPYYFTPYYFTPYYFTPYYFTPYYPTTYYLLLTTYYLLLPYHFQRVLCLSPCGFNNVNSRRQMA